MVLSPWKAEALEESPRQRLDEKLLELPHDRQAAELETRYSELQLLHELSKAVLSSPDIQSTLSAALKNVLASTHLDIGNIRLFDRAGQFEHDAYLGYRDEDNTARHRADANESDGGILVPRVMASRGSLTVTDIDRVEGLRTFKSEGVKSAVLVPIATEIESLGIIEVGSRKAREFRAEEIRLLEIMAAQIGVAVQKARLFEQIRLNAQETQRRQEEQAAINAIAMATTESLHVDELLKIALAKVLEVTGRKRGSIKLKDPATGKIFLAAHQGISPKYAQTIRSHFAPEEKAAEIFNSGEVVVVNDPEKNIFNTADREAGLRSLIWVPLKARGEIIGILNVSTPQSKPFSAQEIELLKNIGNVVGIAVENARLFEETERRGREQAALYAVTAVVGSSFDLDQTLAKALDIVLEVTGMDSGYIYLLEGEPTGVMVKAHRGMSEAFVTRMDQDAIGAKTAQLVATKEPLILENIPADHDGRFKGENVTAAGWFPIVSKNTVVGVLAVCAKNGPIFPRVQMPLLTSVANALGVALENARLFQETRRHLKRLEALREIDQAISSTLDLDNVLRVLLEKIDLTLPYASATIRLVNRHSGLLEPVACRNLDEREWKTKRAGRGIPSVVFESKAPIVIRDVRKDPRAEDIDFYRRYDLISYVGAPLTVKEEIIGVLGFYTKEEHDFTVEEINFLATLAGQAAIAIQNSQLYEEARLRETQLEESNRMLSALHAAASAASQSLDLDRVLQAVIGKITDIFGFSTTQVHIYNACSDELVLSAHFDKEPDAPTSAQSFRIGEGIVGKVAASGKPLIFENVKTDPVYGRLSRNKLAGRLGHRFFAVFPVRGKLKRLGTLACTGIEPRRLTPSEIKLIEALTDQLAVAIENSELYDQLKQKIQELERANKVKDEFLSVMSHELRTPLNVVIGYAGLIREGMLGVTNPEQNKALDKLVSRTNDLLYMITSILNATSIEANEVRVENLQFALGDLLDEMKRIYANPGKPVEIEWDYAPELPMVYSDRGKIKCILQNIIGNAIKFTEKGRVTVSARLAPGLKRNGGKKERAAAAADRIEFRISDTGIGISAEKIPVIFDKFCQVDSSETRQFGGVGLGLHIAKSFADLLGGKIAVETVVGRGSTFTVSLPCRGPADKAAADRDDGAVQTDQLC